MFLGFYLDSPVGWRVTKRRGTGETPSSGLGAVRLQHPPPRWLSRPAWQMWRGPALLLPGSISSCHSGFLDASGFLREEGKIEVPSFLGQALSLPCTRL